MKHAVGPLPQRNGCSEQTHRRPISMMGRKYFLSRATWGDADSRSTEKYRSLRQQQSQGPCPIELVRPGKSRPRRATRHPTTTSILDCGTRSPRARPRDLCECGSSRSSQSDPKTASVTLGRRLPRPRPERPPKSIHIIVYDVSFIGLLRSPAPPGASTLAEIARPGPASSRQYNREIHACRLLARPRPSDPTAFAKHRGYGAVGRIDPAPQAPYPRPVSWQTRSRPSSTCVKVLRDEFRSTCHRIARAAPNGKSSQSFFSTR